MRAPSAVGGSILQGVRVVSGEERQILDPLIDLRGLAITPAGVLDLGGLGPLMARWPEPSGWLAPPGAVALPLVRVPLQNLTPVQCVA